MWSGKLWQWSYIFYLRTVEAECCQCFCGFTLEENEPTNQHCAQRVFFVCLFWKKDNLSVFGTMRHLRTFRWREGRFCWIPLGVRLPIRRLGPFLTDFWLENRVRAPLTPAVEAELLITHFPTTAAPADSFNCTLMHFECQYYETEIIKHLFQSQHAAECSLSPSHVSQRNVFSLFISSLPLFPTDPPACR